MKTLLQILLVLGICGVAVGVVASNAKPKPMVPKGQEEEAAAVIARVKRAVEQREDPNAKLPQASCPAPNFDFGLMDPLTVGQHTFLIQNVGTDTLVIQSGPTSCKCTLSDLESATVRPGESHPVTLTWNSGHAKRQFEQLAVIRTNDPLNEEIRLQVTGEVRAVMAAYPTELNLGRLIPANSQEYELALYSQIWESLEILKIESTSQYISAELSDISLKQRVARDDEINDATATALLRVRYDGNAPQGSLSGRLRVFVKPPSGWAASQNFPKLDEQSLTAEQTVTSPGTTGAPEITFPTQEDGTILCEIPFSGTGIRRVSLYGKSVHSDGTIDLGKLFADATRGSQWMIIGRVRGGDVPNKIVATTAGIPGLVANVEEFETTQSSSSFRIRLELTETLEPAIYNRDQAGVLKVEAPGMPPGDNELVLPVSLMVIKK